MIARTSVSCSRMAYSTRKSVESLLELYSYAFDVLRRNCATDWRDVLCQALLLDECTVLVHAVLEQLLHQWLRESALCGGGDVIATLSLKVLVLEPHSRRAGQAAPRMAPLRELWSSCTDSPGTCIIRNRHR